MHRLADEAAVSTRVVDRAFHLPAVHLDVAAVEIDALDAAAAVVIGAADRADQTVRSAAKLEAVVVAIISLAVEPDRGAVGSAAEFGDSTKQKLVTHRYGGKTCI